MERTQRLQRRREVLHDAAAVYQFKDEAEIRERLVDFRATWGERGPKVVAPLERVFARTIVYLTVRERARGCGKDWRVTYLRSTSALEQVQRQFRQKTRQAVIFHADKPVDAAVYLVISHHHLLAPPDSSQAWCRVLEGALVAS